MVESKEYIIHDLLLETLELLNTIALISWKLRPKGWHRKATNQYYREIRQLD